MLEVYLDSELYLLFLSGNTLILHLGDNLIFTLIVGDILTLRLSDQSTLLLSYIIANLFTDSIISRRNNNSLTTFLLKSPVGHFWEDTLYMIIMERTCTVLFQGENLDG